MRHFKTKDITVSKTEKVFGTISTELWTASQKKAKKWDLKDIPLVDRKLLIKLVHPNINHDKATIFKNS